MGAENEHLNKISTCVLESVDVAYGGDRYIAYEDGVPQVTKLSLDVSHERLFQIRHPHRSSKY